MKVWDSQKTLIDLRWHSSMKSSFNDYVVRTHTSEIQSVRGRKGSVKVRGSEENHPLHQMSKNVKPWCKEGECRSNIFKERKRKCQSHQYLCFHITEESELAKMLSCVYKKHT